MKKSLGLFLLLILFITSTAVGQPIGGGMVGGEPRATETVAGIAELATDAEAAAGTDDTTIMTPHDTAVAIAAIPGIGSSETYGSGWNSDTSTPQKNDIYDYLHQIDTNDDGDVDNIDATYFGTLMASPGTIGGTTPAPATFTGLTVAHPTNTTFTTIGTPAVNTIPYRIDFKTKRNLADFSILSGGSDNGGVYNDTFIIGYNLDATANVPQFRHTIEADYYDGVSKYGTEYNWDLYAKDGTSKRPLSLYMDNTNGQEISFVFTCGKSGIGNSGFKLLDFDSNTLFDLTPAAFTFNKPTTFASTVGCTTMTASTAVSSPAINTSYTAGSELVITPGSWTRGSFDAGSTIYLVKSAGGTTSATYDTNEANNTEVVITCTTVDLSGASIDVKIGGVLVKTLPIAAGTNVYTIYAIERGTTDLTVTPGDASRVTSLTISCKTKTGGTNTPQGGTISYGMYRQLAQDGSELIRIYGDVTNGESGNNTFVGYYSGRNNKPTAFNSGSANTFVGGMSGQGNTTGYAGTSTGFYSLGSNTTGYKNTAMGRNCLASNTTGSENTAIGDGALYTQTTGGSGNVAIGSNAGYYETGSNGFYVNNVLQSNIARDKAYSLLYGTFSGTGGSKTGQQLTINGKQTVSPGTTGGYILQTAEATANITANHTITITLNIPIGAEIKGVQLRVDAALVAGETWNANYNDGSDVQAIAHEEAVAKQTKINVPFNCLDTAGTLAPLAHANLISPVMDAATNIVIQKHSNPGVDAFTAQGTIRAIVYYYSFTAMADAP